MDNEAESYSGTQFKYKNGAFVHGVDWIREVQAVRLLANRYGELRVTELDRPKQVADAMQVFVLSDSAGLSRAVLHCSPFMDPDAVRNAVRVARDVKSCLNPQASAMVLDVLAEGRVAGLSYAVSPFCYSVSVTLPWRWIQSALLRPHIFDWLWQVARSTQGEVGPECKATAFVEPLTSLTAMDGISLSLRLHAERALERLASGAWQPRYVLMHGDLWRGNVMIRPRAQNLEWWPKRAVIIDWAFSLVRGYAIYDLVRIAESMNLSAKCVRYELERHCQLLGCELADSWSYLVAALAYLQLHLGCFQVERYLALTERCCATLERAL